MQRASAIKLFVLLVIVLLCTVAIISQYAPSLLGSSSNLEYTRTCFACGPTEGCQAFPSLVDCDDPSVVTPNGEAFGSAIECLQQCRLCYDCKPGANECSQEYIQAYVCEEAGYYSNGTTCNEACSGTLTCMMCDQDFAHGEIVDATTQVCREEIFENMPVDGSVSCNGLGQWNDEDIMNDVFLSCDDYVGHTCGEKILSRCYEHIPTPPGPGPTFPAAGFCNEVNEIRINKDCENLESDIRDNPECADFKCTAQYHIETCDTTDGDGTGACILDDSQEASDMMDIYDVEFCSELDPDVVDWQSCMPRSYFTHDIYHSLSGCCNTHPGAYGCPSDFPSTSSSVSSVSSWTISYSYASIPPSPGVPGVESTGGGGDWGNTGGATGGLNGGTFGGFGGIYGGLGGVGGLGEYGDISGLLGGEFGGSLGGDFDSIPEAQPSDFVVVVNPTEIAVALYFESQELGACSLYLGSAEGDEAAYVRREAQRRGIAIVQDVSLAQQLHHIELPRGSFVSGDVCAQVENVKDRVKYIHANSIATSADRPLPESITGVCCEESFCNLLGSCSNPYQSLATCLEHCNAEVDTESVHMAAEAPSSLASETILSEPSTSSVAHVQLSSTSQNTSFSQYSVVQTSHSAAVTSSTKSVLAFHAPKEQQAAVQQSSQLSIESSTYSSLEVLQSSSVLSSKPLFTTSSISSLHPAADKSILELTVQELLLSPSFAAALLVVLSLFLVCTLVIRSRQDS